MRLRWQLAVTLAAMAGVAALAASLAAYRSTASQSADETDAFLVERVEEIVDFGNWFDGEDRGGPFGPRGPFTGFGGFGGDVPFVRPDADTVYINPDGTLRTELSAANLGVTDAEAAVAATGRGEVWRDASADGRGYRVLTAPLSEGDPGAGAVQVARDVTETRDVLSELRTRLAFITITVAAAAAAIGWLLARQLARPLERLTAAAVDVAETKRFDGRLDDSATGEVGDVTRSFNAMLGELERSRRQQQQLVADANHELRTPIATLSANLELLERSDVDPHEQADILGEARAQLTELTTLADQLTSAASTQFNAATRTRIDLGEIVDRAIASIPSDRTIEVTRTDSASVYATAETLVRAVAHLLLNAHKYAPVGAPTEVVVRHSTIIVRDHGPGIAEADLDRVFDPFFRADEARAQPGSGLGLALVKQIVEDHNGTVTAANAPDGDGAVLTIELPPASEQEAVAP